MEQRALALLLAAAAVGSSSLAGFTLETDRRDRKNRVVVARWDSLGCWLYACVFVSVSLSLFGARMCGVVTVGRNRVAGQISWGKISR